VRSQIICLNSGASLGKQSKVLIPIASEGRDWDERLMNFEEYRMWLVFILQHTLDSQDLVSSCALGSRRISSTAKELRSLKLRV
jgi:hypothetical protein